MVVNEKTGIGLLLNMHLSGEKKMGDSYCFQVSYIIYNFLSIDDISLSSILWFVMDTEPKKHHHQLWEGFEECQIVVIFH